MPTGAVIALSHGGGPMPLLGDPQQAELTQSMREKVPEILRLNAETPPRAIIVVTAHWQERRPTISSGKKHGLLYDYYGFPPEMYKLKYEADGAPEIAEQIAEAMRKEGLEPELDDERGWDHGVFVPMLLIHPQANIPIVQVSVLDSESPIDHFRMGRALGKLREQNIAIIGSGFATFHNLRKFQLAFVDRTFKPRNDEWSVLVTDAVEEEDPETRLKKMEGWREWPNAYEMHPRYGAEHFLPLIVAAGAAGKGTAKSYSDRAMGLDIFSYYWD